MKIKRIAINNYVGVKELNWNPNQGINILEGVKGSGKTSILEAIETAFSNNKRRTEVIRHGENEATLYIETDEGLEIDRRLRNDKADYMKLRQEGKAINSTERELRKLISGDIFRPLDFVNMDIKKQTEIILSMIEMDYSLEDIIKWFDGEVLGINYDKHILQILKDIEVKYFKEREEVNRQIKTLSVQCNAIEKELPANYDGEEWREKDLQDYYKKINEAQQINNWIEQAKQLKESFESRIDAINSELENQKSKLDLKYKDLESDIKDIIDLSKNKIQKSNGIIVEVGEKKDSAISKLRLEEKEEIRLIQAKYRNLEINKIKEIEREAEEQKELIQIQEQKIASKESELLSLNDKKVLEIKGLEKESIQKIETEKARVGKAIEYLSNNDPVDIEPLQAKAEKVAEMQSYLREWDRLQNIINGQLADKKMLSANLTEKINTARQKPTDLLKTHKLPIEGIGVDEKGMIRINGTLLDGLSDGEKLEVAFKVALQRMGKLKIMCLDGFEKLNESEQEKVIKICDDNNIQAFITIVKEKEFKVKEGK